MKGFDNLVCSSSLGERITPFPATKEKNQIRALMGFEPLTSAIPA